MDEETVRDQARLHAEAVQRGDLRTAAKSLTEPVLASAPSVMAALPDPVTSVEIPLLDATQEGGWVVHISYCGADDPVTVESQWAEVNGHPMVTRLRVI